MSRFMSAVWVVQVFVLLAATATCVAYPSAMFSFLGGCDASAWGCALIATDPDAQSLFTLVRLLAPFLFAFALISLQAVMHEDERVRRNLSFIFAFVYAALVVLIATGNFSDSRFRHADFAPRLLFAGLVTLVLLSLYDAIRAGDRGQRVLSLLFTAAYAALAVVDQRSASVRTVAAASAATFLLDTLIVERERIRARLFTVALLFPAVFVATDSLGGALFRGRFRDAPSQNFLSAALSDEPLSSQVFLAVIAFCAVIHALYAVWPADPAAGRRLSGSANTRPPSLWALWLAQGLMFLAAAGLLFFWFQRDSFFGFLRGVSDARYGALFERLKAIYPAFMIAMALFSFLSMQASREWLWKARCLIFAAFWAVELLGLLVAWNTAVSQAWGAAAAIWSLLLLVVHIKFHRSHGEWFSEEVGEGPDGWILIDLVLGPFLLLKTLLTGRRASHARGVAAWGSFRVLPPGERPYPEHDFFTPGRELPLRIRFANERTDDDVAADARGAAIRLSSSDQSPFDLLLSTGSYSAAENVLEMGKIAVAGALGRPGRRWLAKDRRFLEGGIAALRRAPESYTQLWYYSQTVRFWVAQDNERYLVRYRLVPWPLPDEESGLPVSLDDFVDRRRSPKDRRPTDYLRRELKMRLEADRRDVLRLQAQFHKIRPEDGVQWYNPATDWHADRHPWIDLAELTLEDVLSDEDAERLCFNPDNAPSSLGTPVSRSFFDHRSIADSERRVMRRVQSLRRWMNETFGLPSRAPGPVD